MIRKRIFGVLSVGLIAAGLTGAGLTDVPSATGPTGAGLQSPVRLGIAGLTHDHVNGILGRTAGGDVLIVGIFEPDTNLASRIALRFGLSAGLFYSDLQKMLDAANPEAVAAFGPISEHVRVVEACAPRGIHVMVEKPLAFSLDQALVMERLAVRHRIHLLTNYETTWYASVHAAYQYVRGQDAIGEIRKIVAHDGHKGPREIGVTPEFLAWLTDPDRNGGGALIDFGCYGANLITWLMGGQAPLAVTAVTQTIKPEIYPKVDDEATVVLTYPRAQGIIQASWNWPIGRKDLEIYGLRGTVFIPDRGTIRIRPSESEQERTENLEPRPSPGDDPFAFLAAVIRGEILVEDGDLSSLTNNVMVVRILDAARRSASTGRTVRLDR
jgi:predicted dehydrogenase